MQHSSPNVDSSAIMTLAARRLDEAAYKSYIEEKHRYEWLPCAATYDSWRLDASDLVVRGYNEAAKEALSAANEDGKPEVEVTWYTLDEFSTIVRRVEDKLRIPRSYWILSGEDGLIEPYTLACNSAAFSASFPVLLLVPAADLEAFKESRPYQTTLGRKYAATLFSLVSPLASTNNSRWDEYVKQRKLCNIRLQESLSSDSWSPNCAMLMQIRDGTSEVLAAIEDLELEKYLSAAAAVTPWVLDVEDDDGDVRNAEIATRLHSLHSPAAVDVKIHYRYRPAYHSVEWYFSVSYRVLDPVYGDAPSKSAREGSWQPLLTFGVDDIDNSGYASRWTPREGKRFHMDNSDIDDVQSLLFGEHVNVSLVDTVRLMLASVGIYMVLRTPVKEKEKTESDEEQNEQTVDSDDSSEHEDRDKFDWFQSVTKFNLLDAGWLGVEIRSACGAELPGDAVYVDKPTVPAYEEGAMPSDGEGYGFDGDDDYEGGGFW